MTTFRVSVPQFIRAALAVAILGVPALAQAQQHRVEVVATRTPATAVSYRRFTAPEQHVLQIERDRRLSLERGRRWALDAQIARERAIVRQREALREHELLFRQHERDRIEHRGRA